MKRILFVVIVFASVMIKCGDDTPTPPQDLKVTVDLTKVPYNQLSDYHLFKGALKDQVPNDEVVLYEPISSLFTDYASKKRFVWIPSGMQMQYQGDTAVLDFPVGSVLIKNFYYEKMMPSGSKKILETRLMIKKADKWIFAEYVWNDEQTEAYLNMNGMDIPISFDNKGTTMNTTYRVPSEIECHTCHKFTELSVPIGPKPQNLNKNMTYGDKVINQLEHWIERGILKNNLPPTIKTVVNYNDTTQPIGLRMRSYIDINCAHCHREGSHCDYRALRLAFSETDEEKKIGVCLPGDEPLSSSLKYIIFPNNTSKSIMHARLSTAESAIRMPLLGRTVVHQEAVDLLKDYINSLEPCQ